jgi:hypothetical protein
MINTLSFSSVGSLKYSLLTLRMLSIHSGGIPWFLTADSKCMLAGTLQKSYFYASTDAAYHRKTPRSYMHRVSDTQGLSSRSRQDSLHGKDCWSEVSKLVLGK